MKNYHGSIIFDWKPITEKRALVPAVSAVSLGTSEWAKSFNGERK